MDWDNIGQQAAELVGALPSWDDVTSGVGGAIDTVSGWASGLNIDPGVAAEMMLPTGLLDPGGLPSDFLPTGFDPAWAAEMMPPGGFSLPDLPNNPGFDPSLVAEILPALPSDFLPNMPSIDLPSITELMPSIPSLPWGALSEMVAPLFGGGGYQGGGGSSGGGGASGSY